MILLILPLAHRMQPKFWKDQAAAANQRILRPALLILDPYIQPDPRDITVWKIMVSINRTFNPAAIKGKLCNLISIANVVISIQREKACRAGCIKRTLVEGYMAIHCVSC